MAILDSLFSENRKTRRDLLAQFNAIIAEFVVKASASQPEHFGVDAAFDQKVLDWWGNLRDNFSATTVDRINREVGQWLSDHRFPLGGVVEFQKRADLAKRVIRGETDVRWIAALVVLGALGIAVFWARNSFEEAAPEYAGAQVKHSTEVALLARPAVASPTEAPRPALPVPTRTPCDLTSVRVGIHDIELPTGVDVRIHIVKPAGIYATYFDGHFSGRPRISHGIDWDEKDPGRGSFNAPGPSVASEAYASFTTEASTTLHLGLWGLDSGQGGAVTPQSQLRVASRDSFRSVSLIGTAGDLPGHMSIDWACAQ